MDIHFIQQVSFMLCVKDWLGGDAFTLFDKTLGKKTSLDTLSTGKYSILYLKYN